MKRGLLIIVIALLGVGLFAYPMIANYFSEKNSSYAADDYAEKISGIPEEDLQKAWEEAEEYNQNLEGNPVHDPFVEGSGMVLSDNYYEIMNIENTMGYVTIPKIKVKLPIYHGTAESTLKKGVGHLEGSSVPIGGIGTHSVLTGHTGLTNAKLFTNLIELKEGDIFFIHVLGRTLAYQVDQIQVAEPSDTTALKRIPEQDHCTLITCTPYGINSHRLLVRGVRIEYAEQMEEEAAQLAEGMTEEQKLVLTAAIISSLVMGIFVIVAIFWSKRKQQRKKRIEELRKEIGKW